MATVREYRAVGAEYFGTAPVRGTVRQILPVSSSAAFAALEDGDSWPHWLDAIESVTWTSPKPFGEGTTRDVVVDRMGTVSERFFAWEEGKRMSFHFTSGTAPFAAFAEDYEIVPLGGDTCELRWSHGAELAGPLRLGHPVLAVGFRRSCEKSLRQLATYLRANAAKYS